MAWIANFRHNKKSLPRQSRGHYDLEIIPAGFGEKI